MNGIIVSVKNIFFAILKNIVVNIYETNVCMNIRGNVSICTENS